jgi:hypothetical protein
MPHNLSSGVEDQGEALMHEGGCLCGALRFKTGMDPEDTGYCHCTLCQKSTGAPVLAWASFPAECFQYITGTPTVYHSSSWGQREFCGTCGTQICYRDSNGAGIIDVNIGSLDNPSSFPPRCHIFVKDKLPWMSLDDHLPQYQESAPGDADT